MQETSPYLIGAYVVACSGLSALTIVVLWRLMHWARRAREEDAR